MRLVLVLALWGARAFSPRSVVAPLRAKTSSLRSPAAPPLRVTLAEVTEHLASQSASSFAEQLGNLSAVDGLKAVDACLEVRSELVESSSFVNILENVASTDAPLRATQVRVLHLYFNSGVFERSHMCQERASTLRETLQRDGDTPESVGTPRETQDTLELQMNPLRVWGHLERL